LEAHLRVRIRLAERMRNDARRIYRKTPFVRRFRLHNR
jgi:hypothetical protein